MATVGSGWWLAAAAWGHPGQHLGLRITISDEAVALDILLSNDYSQRLIPSQGCVPEYSTADHRYHFEDPEKERQLRGAYERFLAGLDTIEIDGLRVEPVLERFGFVPAVDSLGLEQPEFLPPDVGLLVVYPCHEPPKRVSIAWELFPEDPARVAAGLPQDTALLAELDAYTERRFVIFSPEEPEVVWHAPAGPVAQQPPPAVTAVTPARIPIPLLSLGLVVVWLCGMLGLRLTSAKRSVRKSAWYCFVVLMALAVYLHDVAVVSIAAPWRPAVRLPSEPEAAEIFATLQRNVYRAFDYQTESDIYDVLALSVAGELLDRIYNEVYQSLIMSDQGGAVARVRSVDVLEAKLLSTGRLPDSGEPAFCIRSRWQVYGVVAHWGHFHSRTNEYAAVYTVAQYADTWKIVGVEVLEQLRIDTDDQDASAGAWQP